MAGYSGTPLAKKLGIKPGAKVLLLDAPDRFEDLLEGLPENADVGRELRSARDLDVAVSFITAAARLPERIKQLQARIAPHGGIWIAWPKKASGVATDVNENIVREVGLSIGLVDNKVCAIDETWSGLRLVIRLKDRPAEKKAKRG